MSNDTKIPARTALIVGATGLVGGHLLDALLADDRYKAVTALVRTPVPLKHDKLTQLEVDFDNLRANEDAFAVQDVFCCLGTTIKKAGSQKAFRKVDYDYPLDVARLAARQGAQQYLMVTALGADKNSLIFYNRVKGEVERDLIKIPFRSIHIMQPSLLLGDRKESRLGEKLGEIALGAASVLMQGPLKKYRGIEAKAVAGAMLQYATQLEAGVHIHESDEIQHTYDTQA